MSNLLKRFNDLLPQPVKVVGIITAVVTDGQYQVDLTGGGTAIVNGQTGLAVDTRVFIVDGLITATAPSLTSVDIDI